MGENIEAPAPTRDYTVSELTSTRSGVMQQAGASENLVSDMSGVTHTSPELHKESDISGPPGDIPEAETEAASTSGIDEEGLQPESLDSPMAEAGSSEAGAAPDDVVTLTADSETSKQRDEESQQHQIPDTAEINSMSDGHVALTNPADDESDGFGDFEDVDDAPSQPAADGMHLHVRLRFS